MTYIEVLSLETAAPSLVESGAHRKLTIISSLVLSFAYHLAVEGVSAAG